MSRRVAAPAPLDLAPAKGKLLCAGHELLRDLAFETLLARAAELGTPVHADSLFAFRPVGIDPERGSPRALAHLSERFTGLPASGAR
jgi:hypothetical protein